jgi:hypothetical protein
VGTPTPSPPFPPPGMVSGPAQFGQKRKPVSPGEKRGEGGSNHRVCCTVPEINGGGGGGGVLSARVRQLTGLARPGQERSADDVRAGGEACAVLTRPVRKMWRGTAGGLHTASGGSSVDQ